MTTTTNLAIALGLASLLLSGLALTSMAQDEPAEPVQDFSMQVICGGIAYEQPPYSSSICINGTVSFWIQQSA